MASLEKRKEMLNKGMVALDSAVHEQKLNFVRAQVSEVNRRIQALMQSNEKGFPNHQNMIRNPILPPSGANVANGRASNSSTPESFSNHNNNNNNNSNNSPASTTWLHSQNQKLAEELEAKSRLIEQLQREKKLYELHNAASAVRHVPHHHHQKQQYQQPKPQQQNIHQAVYMR
uniref:Uncharacterized protein n=1 Tax=Panagrolaimus sp. PS1159 TaxID=55785 RepID=A0AC35FSF2_9BILA